MSTRRYKDLKRLKKENLQDNMSTLELVLNVLAEATTTEFTKVQNPQGFMENQRVARQGRNVAGSQPDRKPVPAVGEAHCTGKAECGCGVWCKDRDERSERLSPSGRHAVGCVQ